MPYVLDSLTFVTEASIFAILIHIETLFNRSHPVVCCNNVTIYYCQ
jgi:hypothetical protein